MVMRISMVERMLAVVRGFPSSVKCATRKQMNPDQNAIVLAKALSKLFTSPSLINLRIYFFLST